MVQVDLDPSASIALGAGEVVFVAVQMVRDETHPVCLDVCLDPVFDDVDGWTYDAEPPFAWQTFTELGVPANIHIALYGEVP